MARDSRTVRSLRLISDSFAQFALTEAAPNRSFAVNVPGTSGLLTKRTTLEDTLITNPWGAIAQVGRGIGEFSVPFGTLEAGQTLNTRTGRLSDPLVHQKTAAFFNAQDRFRRAREHGLQASQHESARSQARILSSLDDLFMGDIRTSATEGIPLTEELQIKQQGFTPGGRTVRSVIGTPKPKPTHQTKIAKIGARF